MSSDSVFQFVGLGMPAASARGVTGSYKPVVGGKIATMLGGADRDLTRPGSRKFSFTVRGSDIWIPPFVGVWPGNQITADLPVLFVESVGASQERPAVPGSLFFIDGDQSAIVPESDAAWRCYNPRSVIHVIDWEIEDDPDGAVATWSTTLREVRYGGT